MLKRLTCLTVSALIMSAFLLSSCSYLKEFPQSVFGRNDSDTSDRGLNSVIDETKSKAADSKQSANLREIKIKSGYNSLKKSSEKRIYKSVLAHCEDITDKISSDYDNDYVIKPFKLLGCKVSHRGISKAVQAVAEDNPDLFWLDTGYTFERGEDYVKLSLNSIMSKNEYKKAKKQFNKVINRVLSKINSGMSDFDKELYIHNYIVKNCTYTRFDGSNKEVYTSYGCLVNKKCVCMGYTYAFNLLLSKAGIETCIVSGVGNDPYNITNGDRNHTWSAIKIDGDWYYTDITWDDTSKTNYDFFNITTKQLKNDHTIARNIDELSEKELYENHTMKIVNLNIPKCTADKYNFYKYKGYNLNTLENNDMSRALARAAKSKKGHFYIYIAPALDYKSAYSALFTDENWEFVKYIKQANMILGGEVLKRSIRFTEKPSLRAINVTLMYN